MRKPLTESGRGKIKPEKKSESGKTFDREWEKTNEIRNIAKGTTDPRVEFISQFPHTS